MDTGEAAKSWSSLSYILEFLLRHHADPQTVLVVVGGGTLSDVGGLAASIFKRGIRWVSVPTTLLAMVDAAWGGKTAINFGGVKNSVGTYHWPVHWIYDYAMLHSLDTLQRFDGWAEMLKHAIIGDPDLFHEIQDGWKPQPRIDSLNPGFMALPSAELIDHALQFKKRIVQVDPLEQDLRRLLNYGHTLAHALESASSSYSHGQAVWLGMLFELKLATLAEHIAQDESALILDLLRAFMPYSGLFDHSTYSQGASKRNLSEDQPYAHSLEFSRPTIKVQLPDWETLWNYMLQDKKIRSGQLSWALPVGIGKGQTGIGIPNETVMSLYKTWSINPML